MSWHTGPLATFDLETTGVDPETARIVSAAFIILSPLDEPLPGSFNRIADPEAAIPAGATAVHGISDSLVETRGLPRMFILDKIRRAFNTVAERGIPTVIYNAKYDLTLFLAERKRLGLTDPLTIGPLIDPLVIDRQFDRYRRGGRKLEAVASHYGVDLDDAHAASADAIASAKIARALGERYPALYDLIQLQYSQARWFDGWRRGINSYWAKKGIDKNIPDHEVWPTHLTYSNGD